MFIEVREPVTNKLLFKYDPARKLVQIKAKGMSAPVLIDLAEYDPPVTPQISREQIARLVA